MNKKFSAETDLAISIIENTNESLMPYNIFTDYIIKAGNEIQGAIDAGFFKETNLENETNGIDFIVKNLGEAIYHLQEGILSE